jgi:predicted PurR-regulated permease PerM
MAMGFSKFFEELGDSAIGLVVAGVTIGFGLELLADQNDDIEADQGADSNASQAVEDTISGVSELASGTTTIASVIVLVLVLVALFMLRQRS